VGDVATRLVYQLRERFLAMSIFVGETLVGLGFLDRVEILALDILDQRHFQRFGITEIANYGWNFMELCPLGGSPAPLAGNDLIPAAFGPHDNWLDQATQGDGLAKFFERCFIEVAARLIRMRPDGADRDGLDARRVAASADRFLVGRFAQKCRKAAPKPARASLDQIISHSSPLPVISCSCRLGRL